MYLTILMPCLNEEATVGICVEDAIKKINELNLDAEVLVIDNGSTDNSFKVAREKGARVIIELNQGYGSALQRGIKEAKGDYIVMLDCDCSYSLEFLDRFIDAFEDGYEFVNGNRFYGNIEKGAMPLSHKIGVPILSYIARKKFKSSLYDFHCGLRGFKKSIFNEVEFKCTGMDFATEMISKVNKNVCEIPVNLYRDKRNGKPHLRTIRDGFKHLKYIMIS